MSRVIVKHSSIQGQGVFASEPIKQGEIILLIDDTQVFSEQEAQLLSDDEKDHLDYIDGNFILMQSPEVYINHSCDPNCFVKTIDRVRSVIARRDIDVGEEIVYDYAINGDYDWGVQCRCGSKYCRGVLDNHFRHLPVEKQIEYASYLDDWFIKKYQGQYDAIKDLK